MEAGLSRMKNVSKLAWISLLIINVFALAYAVFVFDGETKYYSCFVLGMLLILNVVNLIGNWKKS